MTDQQAHRRGEQPPRTKGDAEALRDRIRGEIRSGTFRDPHAKPEPKPEPDARLTVGDVIDRYITRHVKSPTRRERAQRMMLWQLALLRRTEIPAAHGHMIAFDQKPIGDVTKADIEAIRDARRRAAPEAVVASQQWEAEAAERATKGQTMDRRKPRLLAGSKGGEVGINRLLERLRHLFSWAIVEGYIDSTPFKRGGQVVVKLTREEPRDRRLDDPGDGQASVEDRLLQHAGPHLRGLIIAGIATGCRVGELLSLQWKDVKVTTGPKGQTRRALMLSAGNTKTNKAREVPVGLKLAAVLDMRRHAPDGRELPSSAFVFGNAVGERIGTVRKAWQTAVLKAHGHQPQWTNGKKNQLTPESEAAYRAIDLHFHDLRREFGSRVLESGSSLVEARDLLGHANISQTSTYLNSTAKALGLAIERKEEYERQQSRVREAQQTDSHTDAECDNGQPRDLEASDPGQVVRH